MRTDRTMATLKALAPLDETALAELAGSAAAQSLLQEIELSARSAAKRPTRARRTLLHMRPRVALAAAAAAAAACVAVAIIVAGGAIFSASPAAAGVRFQVRGNYIIARVTHPFTARDQLQAAFQQEGIDISVRLVPVSPSLRGTVVYLGGSAGASEIQPLQGGPCVTGGGGCPIGLKIPRDYSGHGEIALGRPAQAGESYASTASAFAPGEALHCSGLLGAPVAEAERKLRELGMSVDWRSGAGKSAPRTGYLWGADPIQPRRVIAWVHPEPLTQAAVGSDIRDLSAYRAALNRGC